ncbi:MAG: ABC transporter ATP-binding protein [Spirochaetes bacterium]|nr:ABC transporter ATP-binding protein [Spirochaetota bacterium]
MVSLELRGLRKAWPSATIDVSLVAPAGSILAVAGPSGCGKSTMLRMAAGLVRPDGGRVAVGGTDVTAAEPRDRGIGMVFQDYALFPHLDVGGNVAYGLRPLRLGRAETARRVARLLAAVDLDGFERRRPHELSGGERQRVALARTLAVEPSVVLFDEPLSSLDASLRKRLRADIVDEQRRLGFTAVYVTHDLEEAMAIGDTLAVMVGGEVLQCDAPSEVWARPSSVEVALFMGSGPCLPIRRLEREGGTLWARTSGGRFPMPEGPEPDLASAPVVFFERSAAGPGGGTTGAEGSFEARCVRADFAGDAVDCLMDSAGDRFTLRFRRGEAPMEGGEASYSVPRGGLGVVSRSIRTP